MLEQLAHCREAAMILSACKNSCCGCGDQQDFRSAVSKPFESLKGTCKDGIFVPSYENKYALVMQIKMPKNLLDPKHWGHLAWKFCEVTENA